MVSIEWEDVWAPEPLWAYGDINPITLLGTKQFLRHLVIINYASLATNIMVVFSLCSTVLVT